MLKDYLFFLILGPVANALWAFWVLPDIHEEGTSSQTLEWIAVQALVPVLFVILLARRQRYIYWFLLVYAALILLFGAGTFGWALMGPGTPASVYVVCVLFFIMGFGILFHGMKDLNMGQKTRSYDAENQ